MGELVITINQRQLSVICFMIGVIIVAAVFLYAIVDSNNRLMEYGKKYCTLPEVADGRAFHHVTVHLKGGTCYYYPEYPLNKTLTAEEFRSL